jgi:hypothetical protein
MRNARKQREVQRARAREHNARIEAEAGLAAFDQMEAERLPLDGDGDGLDDLTDVPYDFVADDLAFDAARERRS